MRINFVTEGNSWILRRWCESWKKCLDLQYPQQHDVSIGVSAVHADNTINMYVNYATYTGKTWRDIGYFTHRELTDHSLQEKFDTVAAECDWCFAQCKNTLNQINSERKSILEPGVDSSFIKDTLVLGVPVKEQAFNRKRLDWLAPLHSLEGVEIRLAGGSVGYHEMSSWYKDVDYVLITSDNEGGPMGVLEAIAMCKPIICPVGVGWCDNYPAIRFKTQDDLISIVKGLIYNRRMWEGSSAQIISVCNKFFKEK